MWGNYFLAGLSSADAKFPMHLWDQILDQEDQALTLIHQECINTTLSSYNTIWGALYFYHNLMDPPGTKVVVQEKLGARGS